MAGKPEPSARYFRLHSKFQSSARAALAAIKVFQRFFFLTILTNSDIIVL